MTPRVDVWSTIAFMNRQTLDGLCVTLQTEIYFRAYTKLTWHKFTLEGHSWVYGKHFRLDQAAKFLNCFNHSVQQLHNLDQDIY